MRLRLLVPALGATLLISGVTPAVTTRAAAIVGSPTITVKVTSTTANPGSVAVTDISGTVISSCQGSTTAGTATCVVPVPANRGVLIVAQPNPGMRFSSWNGNPHCQTAPGPVCHIEVYARSLVVNGSFANTGPGPVITTTSPSVVGDTAGCVITGSDTVTANGTGFAATTPITLSDNGNQVASGTTDSQGFAQLTYTAASEAGVYRMLVMGAGAQTATIDMFSVGEFCQYSNVASGMITLTVVTADLDANTTGGSFKFGTNPRVPINANASGVGNTTSPAYPCASGTVVNFTLDGKRGIGTSQAYHYATTYTITC